MQLLNIINNCFEYSLEEKGAGIEHTLNHILSELCDYIKAPSGGIAEKWISDDGEPYLKYYALHNIPLDDEMTISYKKHGYLTGINIPFGYTNQNNVVVVDNKIINIFPLLSKNYDKKKASKIEVIGMLFINAPELDESANEVIEIFVKFIANIISNIRGIQELEYHKLGFIANMSHEVRTPLNGIISMIDIIMKTELNPLQKNYIEIIKNCGVQLLDIVNDVLDYSKIITNGMKLKLAPIHLYKTISIVNSMLYQKASEKGLIITTTLDPSIPEMIIADSTRLKQVLINIISNSIKFTKKGGIDIAVKLQAIRDIDCTLEFIISDTGIGIPENKLDRIFDSFKQIDNDYLSEICGVGLGLPITKHIIELHNGTITATSKLDQGTQFKFTMDFLLFNDFIDHAKLCTFYSNKNVLLIDADHNERACLFGLLSEFGVRPIMASCISDALIYLSNAAFTFEFIVININTISAEEMHKINHMKNQTIKIIIVDMESIENNNISYDYKLVRPIDASKLNYLLNIIYVSNQYQYKNNQNEIIINGRAAKLNEINIKNTVSKMTLKMLIAEDNKQNQQVLLNILNHINITYSEILFDIIIADDGKDALDNLCTGSYDIAFIDLKMPGIDGIKVCQNYKKQANNNCICIAVTASMSDEIKHSCFAAGMNGFISKPIDMNSIETIIKLVINKKTYI
jgi:signal transduction histidine kinase/response regulator RpfG family c-di-GMP phosphodiesterase